MKIAITCLTQNGYHMATQIVKQLREDTAATIFVTSRCYDSITVDSELGKYVQIINDDIGLKKTFQSKFHEYNHWTMIMSLGIVFRMAPTVLIDKFSDPSITVIDDAGQFAVAVCSGHWGGGNEFTKYIATIINAVPVITTGTDTWMLPAVDVIAKNINTRISRDTVLAINSAIIHRMPVYFWSDWEADVLLDAYCQFNQHEHIHFTKIIYHQNHHPTVTKLVKDSSNGVNCGKYREPIHVIITNSNHNLLLNSNIKELLIDKNLNSNYYILTPRNIILGIGCKRNTPADMIEQCILDACHQANVSIDSVRAIASIDLKQDELGIQYVAEKYNCSFLTVTKEQILVWEQHHEGKFSKSQQVKDKVGVNCVCEPAAMIVANQGKVILPKTIYKGVTIALVEEKFGLLA
ncbi:hypothetical protein BHU72_07950 [Desulfuribacillus stibiiarsenatis]|uniref:Cobalamin biosynthesis protein CbiG n=1 Tax=Desulfuribacillus stibiiarsenatis TaxID=1390249 RepID=A0A1E5L3R8_9FIRM|nr:cobalamin biosynthesis protein [Desulfuribacillus stibiiarsenatis]OEH84757.1 hypothetical protein BHU72_07950 [Desulfuribacillus stibiiarsenatis]